MDAPETKQRWTLAEEKVGKVENISAEWRVEHPSVICPSSWWFHDLSIRLSRFQPLVFLLFLTSLQACAVDVAVGHLLLYLMTLRTTTPNAITCCLLYP